MDYGWEDNDSDYVNKEDAFDVEVSSRAKLTVVQSSSRLEPSSCCDKSEL